MLWTGWSHCLARNLGLNYVRLWGQLTVGTGDGPPDTFPTQPLLRLRRAGEDTWGFNKTMQNRPTSGGGADQVETSLKVKTPQCTHCTARRCLCCSTPPPPQVKVPVPAIMKENELQRRTKSRYTVRASHMQATLCLRLTATGNSGYVAALRASAAMRWSMGSSVSWLSRPQSIRYRSFHAPAPSMLL